MLLHGELESDYMLNGDLILQKANSGRKIGEDGAVVNEADLMLGKNITFTILAGQSVSDAQSLDGGQLATFHMPAAWTTADITFLVAPTADGTYQPLYFAGEEVTETVAAGQCVAPENYVPLASVRFLKIQSGTTDVPVTQTAAREIKITVKR